jgi:ABC-type microcin C transport system duplicated ATPase subunit YejF
LFISHDLRAIRRTSDRIVDVLGRIVEQGEAKRVHDRPLMPY